MITSILVNNILTRIPNLILLSVISRVSKKLLLLMKLNLKIDCYLKIRINREGLGYTIYES